MPFFSTMAGTRCLGSVKAGIIRLDIGTVFVVKYTNDGTLMWAAPVIGGVARVQGVVTDSNGNIFVCAQATAISSATVTFYNATGGGSITRPDSASNNLFIAKYDVNGTVLWVAYTEFFIPRTPLADDGNHQLVCDSSNNLFIAGSYGGGSSARLYSGTGVTSILLPPRIGVTDIFMAKFDTSGVIQWAFRLAGVTIRSYSFTLSIGPSGNLYLSGAYGATYTFGSRSPAVNSVTLPYSGTGNDVFIAKYDPDGALIWATRISSPSDDKSSAITVDSNENVFVTTSSASGTTTFFSSSFGGGTSLTSSFSSLAKYDSNGNALWASRLGLSAAPAGLGNDSSGNIYMAGWKNVGNMNFYNASGSIGLIVTNSGVYAGCLVKYAPNGTPIWGTKFIAGASTTLAGYALSIDSNANIFVTGSSGLSNSSFFSATPLQVKKTLTNLGSNDAFVAKYNSNGNIISVSQIGGTGSDIGNSIGIDPSGNVIAGGPCIPPVTFADAV